MSPEPLPTPNDELPPARCGTMLLAIQEMHNAHVDASRAVTPNSRQPMPFTNSHLRIRAAIALDALATNAPADRDDIVAAIVVIDSEAERLGDHRLDALGEQLRVVALLDSPKADDAIRSLLAQLAEQLGG